MPIPQNGRGGSENRQSEAEADKSSVAESEGGKKARADPDLVWWEPRADSSGMKGSRTGRVTKIIH